MVERRTGRLSRIFSSNIPQPRDSSHLNILLKFSPLFYSWRFGLDQTNKTMDTDIEYPGISPIFDKHARADCRIWLWIVCLSSESDYPLSVFLEKFCDRFKTLWQPMMDNILQFFYNLIC